VYTQKNETADHYIERLCDSYAREVEFGRLEIEVATSDNVEQVVVLSRGARRISSRELLREMESVRKEGAAVVQKPAVRTRNTVMDRLPEEVRRRLEEMRKG
jgi:predicted RNA-binding protein with PIN domain